MSSLEVPDRKKLARSVFGQVVDDDDDDLKEQRSLTYSPSPGKEAEKTDNDASITASLQSQTKTAENKENGYRDMRRLRQSPLRRDLVKQTQDAIRLASASVNQTLQAAKLAKKETLRHQIHLTRQVKHEWQQEKQEAISFHQQAMETRRQLQQLQRNLSSKYSRERAKQRLLAKQRQLQQVEQESLFQSAVYRDHQKMILFEQQERRRKSIQARAKLRQNYQKGKERLHLQRIDEEQAIFNERYETSKAKTVFQKTNAEQRRRSFAFRLGDARRIRELHAKMEQEKLEQQAESYKLKWDGERDAQQAKREWERARRESLAKRNLQSRQQRLAQQETAQQELQAQHESYELKWAGENDANAYKLQLEESRRQSLANRNQYARQQREMDAEEHCRQRENEHTSFELKWAAEKDAQEFQALMEQDRRKSLAGRHQVGKQQRDAAQDAKAQRLEQEHASYELKFAAERDADVYKRQIEAERRASLQKRNAYAREQRDRADQLKATLRQNEHDSYELKWAGEKDAEAYQRKLEQERRESLAERNNERARHAQVMKELETLAHEREVESLVLKWAGEDDAKRYLAQLDEQRRKSLQQRGKQLQHHRQVEEQQREAELQRIANDEMWHSGDQKDVEAYKKECANRDRASLQYRRKEAHIRRLEDEERRLQEQEEAAANLDLETQARADVEEYLDECKRRRRLSLAFRAKEKRRHEQWRRKHAEAQRHAMSQEVMHRLMDQRSAELAKHQERARRAMDAIRHAGCTFNPFSGILD